MGMAIISGRILPQLQRIANKVSYILNLARLIVMKQNLKPSFTSYGRIFSINSAL